ncbi:MAG: N-acetylmuramoyl-L-alanine amidase [Beijerinckiaceae bacterium]|nr:N-acetylmuramoyl-L-alanine amidase [Beijerinckiaceae bacterium]
MLASPAWRLMRVCGLALAVGTTGIGAAAAQGSTTQGSATQGSATQGSTGARAAKPQYSLAEASSANLVTTPDMARLTFDLTQDVESEAFVLTGPDRVIVDLPQVDFNLGSDAGKPAPLPEKHAKQASVVESFRFGLLEPGRSRIVIDLGLPARILRSAVEKTGDKYRLVIELAKTDRASFRQAAQGRQLPAMVPAAVISSGISPTAAPVSKAVIVLDPGHGGPDTGAMVNGVVEKTVALDFAQDLAKKLETAGGFSVVMTRASDLFIPLSERVRIARAANAALMISIHADTLTESGEVGGATVYTVSDKASDAASAKFAAKENAADASAGLDGQADAADVSDILFDLTRQETRAYSHVFARTLVNYWKVAGRLNKNPQRAAGFIVLKAPDVPSVLLELGYLSNASDSAALTSAAWRDKATSRMAEAIVAYFADRHGVEKAAAGIPIPDPGAKLRQAEAGAALK